MRIAGRGGRLRVGFQTAATLGVWTLTREKNMVYRLQAAFTESDSYWLQQRPIDVRLLQANRVWAWTNVDLKLQDGACSIVMHDAPEVL